jgi:hypothetical protein
MTSDLPPDVDSADDIAVHCADGRWAIVHLTLTTTASQSLWPLTAFFPDASALPGMAPCRRSSGARWSACQPPSRRLRARQPSAEPFLHLHVADGFPSLAVV